MNVQVERKVKEIIKECCELEMDAQSIQSGDKLIAVGVNSLRFIKIVVALEKEFDFDFDPGRMNVRSYKTVQDLISYTEKNVTV